MQRGGTVFRIEGLSYVKSRRLCLSLSNSSDGEATSGGLTYLYNYLTVNKVRQSTATGTLPAWGRAHNTLGFLFFRVSF